MLTSDRGTQEVTVTGVNDKLCISRINYIPLWFVPGGGGFGTVPGGLAAAGPSVPGMQDGSPSLLSVRNPSTQLPLIKDGGRGGDITFRILPSFFGVLLHLKPGSINLLPLVSQCPKTAWRPNLAWVLLNSVPKSISETTTLRQAHIRSVPQQK